LPWSTGAGIGSGASIGGVRAERDDLFRSGWDSPGAGREKRDGDWQKFYEKYEKRNLRERATRADYE
jgi:hypothetical protein